MFVFIILFIVFLIIELGYFKIATIFSIVDKPNERSSHQHTTIRGGGIIFPLAWLIYSVVNQLAYPWVTLGVLMIAAVSFADDRMALSARFRFLIHTIAFSLCFVELGLFSTLPWWGIISIYIVGIGCVNAVNFMDGINGMTGLYILSLLLPLQLYWFNTLWNGSVLNYLMVSVLVFGIFNFRIRAKCFAGDVGSVSLGFIVVFLMLGLMLNRFVPVGNVLTPASVSSNSSIIANAHYILLLALYGFDVILTLIQRLYLNENIFKPHRKHLYQVLVNEYKINHMLVSFIYAIIQLSISYWIMQVHPNFNLVLLVILSGTFMYSTVKWMLIRINARTSH